MTTKLELYRDALLIVGQERIADLTETSAARYTLDDHYDKAISYCLEQGFWNFAMRAVQIDSSASVTPTFGYSDAFTKPSDFIRLHTMSVNEAFNPPLLDVVDEPNYWYANCDPLFVKYVSDSVAYGRDLSLWPESFADYVAHRLAVRTCKRITGSAPDDDMKKDERRALASARAKDAMNEPPGFPPEGSWVSARRGSGRTVSRIWDGNLG